MDEVGFGEAGEVGAVVDDERDAEAERDLAGLLEHGEQLAVGQRLLADLDDVHPAPHGRLQERLEVRAGRR